MTSLFLALVHHNEELCVLEIKLDRLQRIKRPDEVLDHLTQLLPRSFYFTQEARTSLRQKIQPLLNGQQRTLTLHADVQEQTSEPALIKIDSVGPQVRQLREERKTLQRTLKTVEGQRDEYRRRLQAQEEENRRLHLQWTKLAAEHAELEQILERQARENERLEKEVAHKREQARELLAQRNDYWQQLERCKQQLEGSRRNDWY